MSEKSISTSSSDTTLGCCNGSSMWLLKGFPVGCVAETILPIELHREGGNTVDQPQLLHGYGRTTLEGRLTIALKRRKFSNTTSVPKNWWKRLTKIQKSELFSFPALQERVAAAVLLEFMKNMQTMRCLLNQIPLEGLEENCQCI